jgi:hypothetical protein
MDDSAIGLTTGPLSADPDALARGIDAMPSSLADRAAGDFDTLPTVEISHAIGRAFAQSGVDPESGYPVMPPEPTIPADAANSQYGIPGQLKFDSDIAPSVAKGMYDDKRAALMRQSVAARQPSGFINGAEGMATDFAVNALDPLTVASSFIPVVGEARYGAWLADAGSALARAGVRAGVGAAQGVVGTAPIAALQYGLSKQEQGDMTATDALLNIAYGGILGGGLHALGGAIGDAWRGAPGSPAAAQAASIDAAPLATKEAALRTAIAQVAEGRPVEVMPVLDLHAIGMLGREAILRRQAGELDEFLGGLDVSPDAPAAADTLARLRAVESQLADENLDPVTERQLSQRRDELVTDTTPEALQELAAPLEIQRQAQAQRANITDMLAQIDAQRTASAASAALSPLPKLQGDPRFAQAARYAAGDPLPEQVAMSAMADGATKAPDTDINAEITNLESALQIAQQHGDLPASIPEIDAANAGMARAKAAAKGFAQAALCIAKGEL